MRRQKILIIKLFYLSGTMTTCMPAAIADLTPFGASSKARQFFASGTGEKRWRQTSKASGAGFPFLTSGSLPHFTMWRKFVKNFVWFVAFKSKASLLEPVLIAWKSYYRRFSNLFGTTDWHIIRHKMVYQPLDSRKQDAFRKDFRILFRHIRNPRLGRELIFQI